MKVNEKVYTSLCLDKPVNVQQGGSSCFGPDTLISTSDGPKKIKDINPKDRVKSYYEKTGQDVYSIVTAVHKYANTKPTIKVRLKNGQEIVATEDHKFYFRGGWCSLKHILSLKET